MSPAETYLPGSRTPRQDRRNEYDVTDTVKVSSFESVREAVRELFVHTYPDASFDLLWMAFHDFDRLFEGRLSDYRGCDTVYHDKQHSLDVTLAVARLIAGHEASVSEEDRLGSRRAIMGLICALFHDAGYIRRDSEQKRRNGAEFTAWHVSRSAYFLRRYLASIGLEEMIDVAAQVVHFSGYELNLDEIELDDPKDSLMGHLLGTGDLIAQMADRCYLEKCRDRLYSEFVLGGVAFPTQDAQPTDIVYASGIELLRKTPGFFEDSVRQRLERKFNHAYRYIEVLYEGRNPYMESIEQNLHYLERVIESEDWSGLRRDPPCFTVLEEPLKSVTALVSRRLADRNAPASALALP